MGLCAQQPTFSIGLNSHFQTTNKVVQNSAQVGPVAAIGCQWENIGIYFLGNYSQYLNLPEPVQKGSVFSTKVGANYRLRAESKWKLHIQLGLNQNTFFLRDIVSPYINFSNRIMDWRHYVGTMGISYMPMKWAELVLDYSWEHPGGQYTEFTYFTASSYVTVGVRAYFTTR
ncbi:MAG: hypothetical protein RL092_1544 [Bacteroidota bacterium]